MTTALLATFNTSAWPIARQDRKLTLAAIASLEAGSRKVGRFVKNRLDPSNPYWRSICRKRDVARQVHYAYTLPWQDGVRLVNPLALEEYQEAMEKAETGYWAAVDAFIYNAPHLVKDAEQVLGEYFRDSDYADLCREAFDFSVSLQPMPHDDQFKEVSTIIGIEKAQELADELITKQSEQWTAATRDVWNRVHGALKHASDKLHHGLRLHDSVLDNLQELTDLLPLLNITNDPDLEQARRELSALFGRFSSVTVKGEGNRKSCADEVDAILAKLPGI